MQIFRWMLIGLAFPDAVAVAAEPVPAFRHDVMAVLSRAGCNAGACHGNLNGKGGLKLSLRGEDPELDYLTLTRSMLGRRTDPHHPEESLLLQKAIGQTPHEGGIRFAATSSEYRTIRNWIAGGAKLESNEGPRLTQLIATPTDLVVVEPQDRVQLQVQARFSDGSTRDVLDFVALETNNLGVAKVLPSGLIIREQPGVVVVLVRYLNLQVPVRVAFIPNRPVPKLAAEHPIDRHVFARLADLRITPAELCSDSAFIRRAFLDTCGILPQPDEVRRFLDDPSANKREKLIDALLTRPEFASFWAMKWSDLLRNEEKSLDRKGVQVFHRWIRNWIDEDKPLNEFAREIVTGRGSTYANPAANFYRSIRDPYVRAESVAQVFLGLRVSCARCHNHPFDVWTQDDYHRFAGVFARIDYRILKNDRVDMLDKHEFIGEQIVLAKHEGELPHPRGGEALPKLLGGTIIPENSDRLTVLGEWLASKQNPFFAPAQANRVWLHLLGRGLVDPNDDFRSTNPATHPELMNHLARQFIEGGFKLKPLVKHILLSRVYQLASQSPNDASSGDEAQFARALIQPLEAEQLLDAISQMLKAEVKIPGYPLGTRAGELPATPMNGRRMADAKSMRFLKVFGKPDRLLTCECERTEDPGALQAFQLITGELVNEMLRDPKNRIGQLLEAGKADEAILEELFLAALARRPTAAESKKLLDYVGKPLDSVTRRAVWEDVAWGLLNSKEFLLRR